MSRLEIQLDQLRRDYRVPAILTVFFTILLLFVIGNSVAELMSHHAKITAVKMQPITLLPQLADLHLLGAYRSTADNLPTTQLQLTLEGTIVLLDHPKQSRALIAAPNEPAQVYQIGDALPGNATVTDIAKHYVVINDNGSLEKLPLPIQLINNVE
ncbi:MAG: hypothetical protein ACD_42C00396G0010 [uncultured bacterium]|nr:MAG: hypothetical protein ACD_42C00396G0010 [uncultured bacterium]OGT33360.1 MAG: hypothetical protein A3C44_04010 [Gammaproteobacteria bacterium RIFCSPHIGHO2_02_FULL_39_13]OGT50302.1 MAG: hypothetical protein A3E53_00935 [Gammaproteobacteria bacterium RIFCSPHIGHO2_12_FULL_39_24]